MAAERIAATECVCSVCDVEALQMVEIRGGRKGKKEGLCRADVINATGRPSPFIPLWINLSPSSLPDHPSSASV